MHPNIHPNAIIHRNAQIGKNVVIGPFCVIGDKVILHDGVVLHSNVVIEGPTSIGQNTQVFQFTVLGTRAQHLLFKGEPAILEIGENISDTLIFTKDKYGLAIANKNLKVLRS